MVFVNSGFHTRKKFSKTYTQFGHVPSKSFANLVSDRKSLNNIGSKVRQIISQPWGPTCLGPALRTYKGTLINTIK